MKLGATDSIKFKKLKQKLKLKHWEAVGLLESIWMFTSRNAPGGDIGKHPDDDITAAIEWDGDPTELITVLVECRWFDRCETNRLLVHDWEDHMPNWLAGNMKKHGKKVASQEFTKQDERQLTTQVTEQVALQSASQEPSYSSLTNSIHTIPILPKPNPDFILGTLEQELTPEELQREADSLTFKVSDNAHPGIQCYDAYPIKRKRKDFLLAYERAVSALRASGRTDAHSFLLFHIRRFASSPSGQDCGGVNDSRPNGDKWLDGERWTDGDAELQMKNGARFINGEKKKPRTTPRSELNLG